MAELLRQPVPAAALVVAVDPGKVSNRVWLTSGERGLIGEPVSLPVLREGVEALARLVGASGLAGPPVIGVEATGRLHHAWVTELERRWPGSVRLFAPSQTQAARAQLGSRRHKTDDRDCAALVWLVRQGAGRPVDAGTVDALLGAVRHRRGRPPTVRSLRARAPGRLTQPTARFWVDRWRRRAGPHPPTPTCAPSGLAVASPAARPCRPTSPGLRPKPPGCWPKPPARSSPACPASRSSGRPRSPPTACRSSASPRPSAVLGHRAGPGRLAVGQPHTPRPDLPAGPEARYRQARHSRGW